MVNKHITIAAFSDLSHDQRLLRISRSLSNHGYRVTLIGRQFPFSVELLKEDFVQNRLTGQFAKGKLAYLEFNLRLFFYLLKQRTDAICAVDLDTLPACWLAARLQGLVLLHDAHEYMEEVPEVYNRPVTKTMWNLVARIFLPGVRACYTVSSSLVEEFREKYGIPFGLVRNIPPLQREENIPPSPYGSGYWVFLGAVNQGRGIEEFLDVLPFTNRKLVVVGSGDRLEAIQKLVREKMLDHMVVFAGKRRPTDLIPILQHAWAGINLLTDEGLSYRYSLANKFFDYVQAGIPQICIAFPEYLLLNQQFEVAVLTSLEIKSIHAAAELISNPLQHQKLAENCLQARQEWNWEQEEKQLVNIYRTAI